MKTKHTNTDCRHYTGDVPCKPHQLTGICCELCRHYAPLNYRILIIKLGDAGEVIQTTSLLRALKIRYSEAQIAWLTKVPEVLPREQIDIILPVNTDSVTWLKASQFNWVINLEKSPLATALTKEIQADKKSGFALDEWGHCLPLNDAASYVWHTHLWHNESKLNKLSYIEEIFLMCGMSFNGEGYILEDRLSGQIEWELDPQKKQIGLNTAYGDHWQSQRWPEAYWIELTRQLISDGYGVVLLGDEMTDKMNKTIAAESKAQYSGYFDLMITTNLINHIDLLVSAVTEMMHLAIGLQKKLVLLNAAFNSNHFYLYERGLILEPEMDCDCYQKHECPNQCMDTLHIQTVYQAVKSLLSQ